MTSRLRLIPFCFILGGVIPSSIWAQSSQLSGLLVLRNQAARLSEEVLGKSRNSMQGVDQIDLRVEGGMAHAIIENAFLESLSRRGIRTRVDYPKGSERMLDVQVLEQNIRYLSLSTGEFRREIRTAIEARTSSPDSAFALYLGSFKCSDVDTVAFREEGAAISSSRDSERTTVDKLLGPILLIGGAFLVVYLFFTVRN